MNQIELDFAQARAKHLQFKSRLRAILYDHEVNEEPVLSHYECGVGKWIYNHALEKYGHLPEIFELEKVHASIHNTARELVSLYKEGSQEKARIGLTEMEIIADKLVELLVIIEQKIIIQDQKTDSNNEEILDENIRVFRELQKTNIELDKKFREQNFDLQKAKQRVDLISIATQDAVWDWDMTTNELWWNNGFYELFGYQKGFVDPSIKFWTENIHPDDRERVEENLQNIIDTKEKQWLEEYLFRKADGTFAYIFDRGYCQYNEDGKPIRMVGSMIDITKRKNDEYAIKESEVMFRTIANASPAALWMSDSNGDISFINQTWIDWTGKPFVEHLRQGWALSILDEDRERFLSAYMEDFKARRHYKIDFRLYHKNGQAHWCLAEGVPRYLSNGDFSGYVGSCVDITERKNIEESLKSTTEELATTNEELYAANEEIISNNEELANTNRHLFRINADMDNFIYTASHDLKAPITNIEGLLRRLIRKLPPEILSEHITLKLIEMMQASVERFKKTIEDLAQITRIEREGNGEEEIVSISEVLNKVLLDLELNIEETNAKINIDLPACPTLHFSAKNLKSIVYNLVSNAIKFRSPERPVIISINCEENIEYQILTVTDNGLGMEDVESDKIFGMFKRIHTHIEGTGIGLYIVKKIIENTGGKIEVESEPGVGTTFKVYFNKNLFNS